jgi:flagellar hook-basal body complex protein FliE
MIKPLSSSLTLPEPSSPQKSQSLQKVISDSINELDQSFKVSENLTQKLVSGESSDIHSTMIALTKAELGLNLHVQVRNKCLEAYSEIMKLQI